MMRYLIWTGMLLTLAAPALAEIPSFTPLGDLPGGTFDSWGYGCSDDGLIVAGVSDSASSEAFLWQAGSMTGLGFPQTTDPSPYSGATAISGDGSVLVGSASSDERSNEPFKWENGVFTPLGRIPGYGDESHHATAVSSDGSRIVGCGYGEAGWPRQAWLWEDGTMIGLGTLTTGSSSWSSSANGISGDGNVVVGGSDSHEGHRAFRWIDGTMSSLGGLEAPSPGLGRAFSSSASDASFDGSVIVGSSSCYDEVAQSERTEAFRWCDGEMIGLGDLPGGDFRSYALAVSSDGSVIAGIATSDSGMDAFVWDSAHGMRSLQSILQNECGIDLTGWTLFYAMDLSADGTVIVGTGINPDGNYEGYRAVIPEPSAFLLLLVGSSLFPKRRRLRGGR